MRGKVRKISVSAKDRRITPAYAGKRNCGATLSATVRDHPRVCGEKQWSTLTDNATQGSPPRMRGKGLPAWSASVSKGITPAYAGKSPSASVRSGWTWDHPRVCGEKLASRISKPAQSGSPPRMRGKVQFDRDLSKNFRITPAYAGKRDIPWPADDWKRDHPRVCGEKLVLAVLSTPTGGSPPRMRGKAAVASLGAWCNRITPAYAGKRHF